MEHPVVVVCEEHWLVVYQVVRLVVVVLCLATHLVLQAQPLLDWVLACLALAQGAQQAASKAHY